MSTRISFLQYLLTEIDATQVAQAEVTATGGQMNRVNQAKMNDVQLKQAKQAEILVRSKSVDPLDQRIAQLEQQHAALLQQIAQLKAQQAKKTPQR